MRRSCLAWLATVGVLPGTTLAMGTVEPQRYECAQGDCQDGQGTVKDFATGALITGAWQGGRTRPGVAYDLVLPLAPGRHFTQVYGVSGLQEKGDMPFLNGANPSALPVFKGSYAAVDHRFARRKVAVPRSGVYDMGNGILFKGRFEYLPAKAGTTWGTYSGYFIFYGERRDEEDGETDTGLYVSDQAFPDMPLHLRKAKPEFLAELQRQYQANLDTALQEFKEEEARRTWMSAFNIIGSIVMLGHGGNPAEIILSMVTDVIDGTDLRTAALKAVGAHVTDPEEEKALTQAVKSNTP